MFRVYLISLFLSLFVSQTVFAEMDSKPCKNVAQSCRAAGYDKSNKFWTNCMKPLLLGQTVKGVNLDPKVIKVCRDNKIERMKKELQQLESVK